MPKIIKNPLRAGLSSKIYLLAYNGPITGYEIAKKIYGKTVGSVPQTNKIYETAKKMLNESLQKTEKGYISISKPVLQYICDDLFLRGNELSELEIYMLEKVVDCEWFRLQVERSFFYCKDFFKYDVDAIHQIAEVLGTEASLTCICSLKDNNCEFQTKKEFDTEWKEHVVGEELTEEYMETYPQIKETIANFDSEIEYFKKTGRFKKGGIYEKEEKNGLIAIDGKEIKYWHTGPPPLLFISFTLLQKLCLYPQYMRNFKKQVVGENYLKKNARGKWLRS